MNWLSRRRRVILTTFFCLSIRFNLPLWNFPLVAVVLMHSLKVFGTLFTCLYNILVDVVKIRNFILFFILIIIFKVWVFCFRYWFNLLVSLKRFFLIVTLKWWWLCLYNEWAQREFFISIEIGDDAVILCLNFLMEPKFALPKPKLNNFVCT